MTALSATSPLRDNRALAIARAIAAPRRAAPLALFGALCVTIELWWAPRWSVALFTASLFTTFCLLAPLSWSVYGHSLAGRILHALNGIACTWLLGVWVRRWLGVPVTLLTDPTGLAALAGVFAFGGYILGRDIQLEEALSHAEDRAEHAQLFALRTHLDPHFLFNTLNAIAEWCREAPEVAEQATLRLSAMLRAMLEAIQHTRWPLSRELQLIDDLFALYQARDPQRFVLEAQIDRTLQHVEIPPLLLLALIENAIKHGPAAGKPGPVKLEVRKDATGALSLSVDNAGTFTGPREGGKGLLLIKRRVAQAYRGRARFTLHSHDGQTHAELALPIPSTNHG